MIENIGDSYLRSSDKLKKSYIRIFFSSFVIKDKNIVKYELTKDAMPNVFVKESVRISTKQLPG